VRLHQAERDQAIAAAAVDAAATFAIRTWVPQLQRALETRAVLAALADLLSLRGADQAATAIREMIVETRRNVTTPSNPAPGRKLLDDLVVDARALLEPS
jgi:hypothetical protein